MKVSVTKQLVSMAMTLCIALGLTVLPLTSVSAQKKKPSGKGETVNLRGTQATARGAADPNITTARGANDPNAVIAPPPGKGGTTQRGAAGTCQVNLDNRTSLYVDVYVDGAYQGTMNPYGDNTTYVAGGATRVYAKAEFSDGSYLYWGPNNYTCGSATRDAYINFVMSR